MNNRSEEYLDKSPLSSTPEEIFHLDLEQEGYSRENSNLSPLIKHAHKPEAHQTPWEKLKPVISNRNLFTSISPRRKVSAWDTLILVKINNLIEKLNKESQSCFVINAKAKAAKLFILNSIAIDYEIKSQHLHDHTLADSIAWVRQQNAKDYELALSGSRSKRVKKLLEQIPLPPYIPSPTSLQP